MAFETDTEIIKVRLPDGTELNFEASRPGGEQRVVKLEDVLDSSEIAKTVEGTVQVLRGTFAFKLGHEPYHLQVAAGYPNPLDIACASNAAPGDTTVGFTQICPAPALIQFAQPIQRLDQQRKNGELGIFSISCTEPLQAISQYPPRHSRSSCPVEKLESRSARFIGLTFFDKNNIYCK